LLIFFPFLAPPAFLPPLAPLAFLALAGAGSADDFLAEEGAGPLLDFEGVAPLDGEAAGWAASGAASAGDGGFPSSCFFLLERGVLGFDLLAESSLGAYVDQSVTA
jgi:hypothetical protein